MYFQLEICIDASVVIDILIPKYKFEGEEGCGLLETFLCRSRNQLHICIDANVGIVILILRYKGEAKERCGMSETFVMQIKESTRYLHLYKC
jgi:hypothetical protein